MTKNTITKEEAKSLLNDLNNTSTLTEYYDKLTKLTDYLYKLPHPEKENNLPPVAFLKLLQKLHSSSIQRFQEGLAYNTASPSQTQTWNALYEYVDLCFPLGS